jgi:hypothetical protein
MMMTKLTDEESRAFRKLLEKVRSDAIKILSDYKDQHAAYDLQLVASQFIASVDEWISALERDAIEITLRSRDAAAAMGLNRALSDWCEDDRLRDAVAAAETYYFRLQTKTDP